AARRAADRIDDCSRCADAAPEDDGLAALVPSPRIKRLAGEIDDDVGVIDRGWRVIPGDVSSAANLSRQDDDVMTVGAQRGDKERAEEAAAAGDDDFHASAASRACASPSATLTRVRTSPPATKNRITDATAARLEPNM